MPDLGPSLEQASQRQRARAGRYSRCYNHLSGSKLSRLGVCTQLGELVFRGRPAPGAGRTPHCARPPHHPPGEITHRGGGTAPGWMRVGADTRLGVATTLGSAVAAMCVQLADASDNLAIHMPTRILLRSSSTHEPSDPPLEVVDLGSQDWV